MRNTNIPRAFGIPCPMNYEILCKELKNNWDDIRKVFRENTSNDAYKVSRVHIRKRSADKALFEGGYGEEDDEIDDYDQIPSNLECDSDDKALFCINYKNWKEDGDPLLHFLLGKKYVIKTDIAQCFPSIYTHAIPWALVGKSYAKEKRGDEWFNKIDKACRNMRDGETHGLMIGPHASNLISEIILTSVDKELRVKGYDYIRNIDDYTCYVETYEKAQKFLIDLNNELRKFDFSINHKKTIIEELPQFSAEFWIQELKDKPVIKKHDVVDFSMARSYLDTAVSLMKTNGGNASAIFYAIKILGNNERSDKANEYCVKTMCYLAIIYPYLVPILDKYVFEAFEASKDDISKFAETLYKDSMDKANFEGVSYALFYARKYELIFSVDVEKIIQSTNCICKVLLLVYSRWLKEEVTESALIEEAKRLKDNDFEENWIFIYEALACSDLSGEWEDMKKEGVTFLDLNF